MLATSADSDDAGSIEEWRRRARGGDGRHGAAERLAARITTAILDAEGSDEFAREICRAVHDHLPAYRVSIGQVHRRLGRFRACYWPPVPPAEERRMLAVFARFLLQHPRHRAQLDGHDDRGVFSWADLDPDGSFRSTDLYRHFYAPYRITDQLTLPLAGPDQLALGMTIDRAGGRFTDVEKQAMRLVQHSLDGVIGRLGGSHLQQALCSVGWSRIVVEVTGEVVTHEAPPGGAALPPGSRLAGEPWWSDVRAALAEGPIIHGGTAPQVTTIDADGVKVIVERPLIGHPVLYVHPDATAIERPLAHIGGLTRRQREVAELIVRGLSAKQIAQTLCVSVATARSHIEHVYRRLGVNNRAQAVALLLERT